MLGTPAMAKETPLQWRLEVERRQEEKWPAQEEQEEQRRWRRLGGVMEKGILKWRGLEVVKPPVGPLVGVKVKGAREEEGGNETERRKKQEMEEQR